MSIGRKIIITERLNVGSEPSTTLPIRKLFNIGPIFESSSILISSNFDYAEVSQVTKKKTNLFTQESETFPTITETYEFYNSNSSLAFSDWQSFVNSNLVTNVSSDHFTNIDGLIDINDANFLGLNESVYVGNVNYEYNFLLESYENVITSYLIDEKILPNMYAIMYAKTEREIGSQETTFDNIITLNGLINSTETYSMQTNAFSSNKPKGEYFDLYADAVLNSITNTNTSSITGPMTNIVIPPEQLKTISQLNEYKELYPMYSEINIKMDKFSSFSTLLKDSGLSLSLINYVINNSGSLTELSVAEQQVSYFDGKNLQSDFELQTEDIISQNGIYASLNTNLQNTNIETYDIFDWWTKTREDFTPNETNNLNTLILGIDDETKKLSQKNYEFARSLSYIIFYGKLRKLIKQTLRSFTQTINAVPSYSEVVFYRVDKFKTGSSIPLQTFWIPNDANIDTFQLIDTQVKYNVEYRYEIYAYNIIVANSVTTSNLQTSDLASQFSATISYTTQPKITLAKIPVYSISNKILDDPPLMPEVTFVPSKNIDNKIKILFNNSTGEEKSIFYSINDDDVINIKQVKTMFATLPNNNITFKSDDIASTFEVYRITNRPFDYGSFSNKLLTNVTTDYNLDSISKASSATFVDTIVPNRKYYYIFRTIDFHGNYSNPTDVYEVEMVNDDGAIYLRKNIIDIKNFALNKKGDKSLKKLVYIKPEILQTIVNSEFVNKNLKSAFDIYTLGSGNVLGIAESPVWNKKFKLRFVSKKTGKMFDLNLQLNVEIDKENL